MKRANHLNRRVARLEEKLDGLVNLLSTSKDPEPTPTVSIPRPSLSSESSQSRATSTSVSAESPELPPQPPILQQLSSQEIRERAAKSGITWGPSPPIRSNEALSNPSAAFPGGDGFPPAPKSGDGHFSPGLDPLDSEACQLLDHYRVQMMPYFPFVVIPEGVDVHALRSAKPFLFKAIITSASYSNLTRQIALGKEVVAYFSEHLLLKGEKSLDLLQGLLIFIAWYHPHLFANPQLTNLLQLSVALLVDLGLNKSGTTASEKLRLEILAMKAAHGPAAVPKQLRLDEQRALLGCFYLTNIVSTCFKKIDGMQYHAHIESCRQALIDAAEYPSDRYLNELVRIQVAVQDISSSLPAEEHGQGWSAPLELYVKSLRSKLDGVRQSLPKELQTDQYLQMHFTSAEVFLFEIGLKDIPREPGFGRHSTRRIDILWSCLCATKRFLDIYLNLPREVDFKLPFITLAQFICTIIALANLSTFEGEDWDLKYVRDFIDFNDVLAQLCTRWETASAMSAVDNDLFARWSRKVRWVRGWYETKLQVALSDPEMAKCLHLQSIKAGQQGTDGSNDTTGMTDLPMPDPMVVDGLYEGLDDSFWQEFMVNWDGNLYNTSPLAMQIARQTYHADRTF